MSDAKELELKRLRWRSRRGLLELDLLLERFLLQEFDNLSADERESYRQLLCLPDNDLLDLCNGRAELDDAAQMVLVQRIAASASSNISNLGG